MPEQFALWFEWGSNNGMQFWTTEEAEEYIATHLNCDGTNGWYVVTDCNNHPIMPEQWLDNGGKLEVKLEKETDRVTVTLRGANIALDVPVYAMPPDVTFPGQAGDIIGFDVRGVMTKDTMFYTYDDTTPTHWKLDTSIKPYPRAPYKICIPHFDTEKYGLYITGNGIRYKKDWVEVENDSYNDAYDESDKEQLTVEIDSKYITSSSQAVSKTADIDIVANGIEYTFDGTILHPNDSDWIRSQAGSWDAVVDFMVYNGYETGNDSWENVTAWWAQFLNNPDFTRRDIDQAVMNGISHHIVHNLFGNVAGSYIIVPNRGAFRILTADIDVSTCAITGEANTTLGDWDYQINDTAPKFTLGDWDRAIKEIQKTGRVGAYTMGMWAKELLRLKD